MDDQWFEQPHLLQEHNDEYCSSWELSSLTASRAATGVYTVLLPIHRDELSTSVERMDFSLSIDDVSDAEASASAAMVNDQSVITFPGPRLRILLSRHQHMAHHDVKPWFMAFKKGFFMWLCQRWNLPPSYLHIRKHASGSGAFSEDTIRDNFGIPQGLRLIVRVPHAPREGIDTIWSMALSWNASGNITSALMDGLSIDDVEDLQKRMQYSTKLFGHQLLLPKIVLDMLSESYTQRMENLKDVLYYLEWRLRTSRSREYSSLEEGSDPWNLDPTFYRYITQKHSTFMTDVTYLERRLDFHHQLGKFLHKSASSIQDEYSTRNCSGTYAFSATCIDLIGALENSVNFTSLQLHQAHCLKERIGAMMDQVNAIIAQNDSKANIQIATATRRDSSSMATIAWVSVFYLPVVTAANLFGADIFKFGGPKLITVSDSFLPFIIITISSTIPFVLFLLISQRLFRRRLSCSNSVTSSCRPLSPMITDEDIKRFCSPSVDDESENGPFYRSRRHEERTLTFSNNMVGKLSKKHEPGEAEICRPRAARPATWSQKRRNKSGERGLLPK